MSIISSVSEPESGSKYKKTGQEKEDAVRVMAY